ncbi:hypothetical protein [Paraburkholderia sp. A3RO-2L]|uniref:hypothetical protein n=1 Tax=unclassified Paraburkholderia TaxID=2615204 RepID=UPI0032F855FD|nr:hypothetical protein [Burkholderia vietnamiensis]
MSLLTVFARREPTTDAVVKAHRGGAGKKDTVFYRDALCTEIMARIPWYQTGHPRRNSTKVTLNCFRWNLQWVH